MMITMRIKSDGGVVKNYVHVQVTELKMKFSIHEESFLFQKKWQ